MCVCFGANAGAGAVSVLGCWCVCVVSGERAVGDLCDSRVARAVTVVITRRWCAAGVAALCESVLQNVVEAFGVGTATVIRLGV